MKKPIVIDWSFFTLAGVTGFEPVNGEFRVHCLTAWLHPNDYKVASLAAFLTSTTPGTSS